MNSHALLTSSLLLSLKDVRTNCSAEVIEFENAGHWLHHDQFDRFMATLRDFL